MNNVSDAISPAAAGIGKPRKFLSGVAVLPFAAAAPVAFSVVLQNAF